MCAKKKAVPSKMWRMAGEPLRSKPLSTSEQEAFSEEFSTYRQFRGGTRNGSNWVSPADARLHQSSAMAVAAFLCERYAGQYGRDAVIKVVSASVAVPAPLSARMARRTDFLLGAALWLLDYWELHCGSEEEYLSLLPPEPDGLLEYDIPFSEDLDHSRDVLLRTLTLLRDRDGAFRKEFRALLALVDNDALAGLRKQFKAAFLDYTDRLLDVYTRLQPVAPEPPPFLGASLPGPDFRLPDDLPPSERPDTIAIFMGPELICRPVAEVQEQLGSRKAAERLSSYGTDDPYALRAAYLLLEREKDALANLNGLTAIVMICAERHLPWTQDDFDARADLSEPGGPDYRLRYEYRMVFEDDAEYDDTPDWLVSEAQLFYIATGVAPPRDQQPSRELIRWFISHGIAEQRARELAFGAMFAYYTDAGEHGWKEFGWPFDDDSGKEDIPSGESENPPSVPIPAEDHAAQAELLARKVKELRGALHDAEQTVGRLEEQLREAQRCGEADRAELAQLRETLYHLRAGEDSAEEDNGSLVELPWSVRRRTVVFGGYDSWRKAVKPLLPGARFYDREALPDLNAIRGADVVWIQPNALSHKYYYRNLRTGEGNTEEDSDPLVELPWQVRRRTVVFGGHDSWRKAVRPLLTGARFYNREALPDLDAIRGADVVWIQPNALSHKYYYRIIDAARKNGIPVRYFGFASAKKCALQFARDELSAQTKPG